jgi:hypothetical protein
MNLLLIGGAFLSAMLSAPDAPKGPVEKAGVGTTISQPAPRAGPVQKAPAAAHEDPGWMTREIIVDQKTGETTEISVIGFAD